MKKITLFLALLFSASIQAQHIPDVNFANAIRQECPSCIDVNDSLTVAAQSLASLAVPWKNISDLTGLDGFVALTELYCSSNQLTSLPNLPASLITLECYNNQLTSLPSLPVSLQELDCYNNQLTSLPTLPIGLNYLSCSSNQLTSLPALPASLTKLRCWANQLTSLPTLPTSLTYLDCNNNQLTTLPVLPSSIDSLFCYYNQLTNLPTLPINLNSLWCSSNQLTNLPTLPINLNSLLCGANQLTNLPILPINLNSLWCDANQLTNLPALPTSLTSLSCGSNQLTNLPTLPSALWDLRCNNNQLTSLPTLPSVLHYLDCYFNQLTSLPTLPTNLEILRCGGNQLTNLPALPASITLLNCYSNQLTSLPTLPMNLEVLSCDSNQLTSLPTLPASITRLYCSSNQLTSLPTLPVSLQYLYCTDNSNLFCLPVIDHEMTVDFSGTPITCVPSHVYCVGTSTPLITSLPICSPSSPCLGAKIYGTAYKDSNPNCTQDNAEPDVSNLKISLINTATNTLEQQVFTRQDGYFDLGYYDGTFRVEPNSNSLPIAVSVNCPSSGFYYDTLAPASPIASNNNFGLRCNGLKDVSAWNFNQSFIFRPTFHNIIHFEAGDYTQLYNLNCSNMTGGTVTAVINGKVDYIGVSNGTTAPTVSGTSPSTTLTWNISHFGTVGNDYYMDLLTNTNANIGDTVCITINVALTGATDGDLTNNEMTICSPVRNSYDPNDKSVSKEEITDLNEWLYYTVRFQNTGNDVAYNVHILDTLSANVDVSSFQVLGSSHALSTRLLQGGIVNFVFQDINLPDSTTNEPGSHGYVSYKLKMKPNLPLGSAVDNTAHIYFDNNSAIVTNTATTTFIDPTINTQTLENGTLKLYPNPTSDLLWIDYDFAQTTENTLFLTDMLGRNVLSVKLTGSGKESVSLQGLANGIYQANLWNGEKLVSMGRVVKY